MQKFVFTLPQARKPKVLIALNRKENDLGANINPKENKKKWNKKFLFYFFIRLPIRNIQIIIFVV